MSGFKQVLCCLLLTIASSVSAQGPNIVPIMGAGPSTKICTLFFKEFENRPEAKGYQFSVEQRSIKHAGGIKASGENLFGRTGRPLNRKEKALGKKEIYLARIPLTFVVGSQTGINRLTLQQLKDISSGKIANWKQVGGVDRNIIFVGREPAEAAFTTIKKQYTFLGRARFQKVFRRDHQVVNYLKSADGAHAISFGAKSNFDPAHVLVVDGFESGINLGLVYDNKHRHHALVNAVIKYAKSPEWLSIVRKSEFLSPSFDQ